MNMKEGSPQYEILGVKINPLTIDAFLGIIADAIANNKKIIIGNHNMHSIYLYNKDDKMRKFYSRADYVCIDGMPLIFIGRLSGLPLKKENRLTVLDWLGPMMEHAARQDWRIFFLGSKPGVAEKGAMILEEKYPELDISVANGYFDERRDSEGNIAVIDLINSNKPNILLVGMGMPRQEHWILDNLDSISANVILDVGAIMDYTAGVVPTPPRWMGKLGLEWLFRLIAEPRRLFFRYVIEPFLLLKISAIKKIQKRKD